MIETIFVKLGMKNVYLEDKPHWYVYFLTASFLYYSSTCLYLKSSLVS